MITAYKTTHDIDNRLITVPALAKKILVEGDANSTIITFRIPRYADGVDLSTKEIFVCFQTKDNTTGRTPCKNISFSNAALTFQWTVPPEAAAIPGSLTYHIDFDTVEDDICVYRLKTLDQTMTVTDSFEVLDNAKASDYLAEKLFLQGNIDRISHSDLSGHGYPYRVNEKTIEMNSSSTVAVVHDNMSRLLQFRLKRFYDGVDRKDMTFCFPYINANGDGDISSACNIFHTDDEIFVGWALDSKVTNTAGMVTFKLGALGYLEDGSFYVWYTDDAEFEVHPAIDVCTLLDEPDFSWYESWAVEADHVIKTASQYCSQTKDYYHMIQSADTAIASQISQINTYLTQIKNYADSLPTIVPAAISDFSKITCSRSNIDDSGNYLNLRYTRQDGTLYLTSELIGDSTIGNYTGRKETRYDTDGVTVLSTTQFPLNYDSAGNLSDGLGSMNQLLYHNLIGKEASYVNKE